MTREEFLKLGADTSIRAVEVPEWGCTAHVRSMSGVERTEFKTISEACVKAGREPDADTHLVLLTACDESGKRIFSSADFELVNSKSAKAITALARAALMVNGLIPEAVELEKKD
jgi:hypothetical protein